MRACVRACECRPYYFRTCLAVRAYAYIPHLAMQSYRVRVHACCETVRKSPPLNALACGANAVDLTMCLPPRLYAIRSYVTSLVITLS